MEIYQPSATSISSEPWVMPVRVRAKKLGLCRDKCETLKIGFHESKAVKSDSPARTRSMTLAWTKRGLDAVGVWKIPAPRACILWTLAASGPELAERDPRAVSIAAKHSNQQDVPAERPEGLLPFQSRIVKTRQQKQTTTKADVVFCFVTMWGCGRLE